MIELATPIQDTKLRVNGNQISLVSPNGEPYYNQDNDQPVTTTVDYAQTPFYDDFEGFVRWAGEQHIRVAAAELSQGAGRVIYIYDARPPFYPTIGDIADEAKRRKERAAMREEPELYGPGGAMKEWQSGGCFGFAWNLDVPYFSEWGTAPFPRSDETVADMNQRHEESRKAMFDLFGGDDVEVHEVVGPQVTVAAIQNRQP